MGDIRGASAVCLVSPHLFSASCLQRVLAADLGASVIIGDPKIAQEARVAIIDAVHLAANALPRVLRTVTDGGGARTILLFDGALPNADVLTTAGLFGVVSSFDVRDDVQVIVQQVRTALAGRRWRHDGLSAQWLSAVQTERGGLTARETQVLLPLLGDGRRRSVGEVADDLGISVATVRVHLANVRRKLGAHHTGNLTALRSALVDRGWLDERQLQR